MSPSRQPEPADIGTPPSPGDDLGLQTSDTLRWFSHAQEAPYVLVRVTDETARTWRATLGTAVRRCYVSDAVVLARSRRIGVSTAEIISATLPDPGSTMAGDFGEILVYAYQVAKEHPKNTVGPRKWRLKQDRTKPAPHSDVIHFVLPTWPAASGDDVLLCAEVKTKSTRGTSSPIKSAIEDSAKDRTGRLARTLVWLKERALREDIDVEVAQLDRFIKASEYPAATKRFRAVAVICESLVTAELPTAPTEPLTNCSVVVIVVPDLHATYEAVFEAAHAALPALGANSPPPASESA